MLTVTFFLLALLFVCWRRFYGAKGKAGVPTQWPVVGMIPALLPNISRIHDYVTQTLEQTGGTFLFKGPIFTNMEMLVTSDPADVNYVLSKNFPNFGRGPDFRNIVDDILGDGIFAAESKSWENQTRLAKSLMSNPSFKEFAMITGWRKTNKELIPFIEDVAEKGMQVDLQQIFQRFTFDWSSIFVLGYDPATLSQQLPLSLCEKSFAEVEESILYRHIVPQHIWKIQKWLQIGREKKLSQAMESIDQFLYYCIRLKQGNMKAAGVDDDPDMLTSCITALAENNDATNVSEIFLKDLMLCLILGGKEPMGSTLCWFFWLLAMNPKEEEKIRDEITAHSEELGVWKFSNMEMLNKLIYLQGALCETLRLFPSLAIQHKAPLKHDILPSGHRIKPNTKVLLAFYSMGRMESIWGKDCRQFKPGRWISDKGQIKVEPSYKFSAFGSGPRRCLGKDIAFVQMKIVAASMLSRFKIEIAEGHPIEPSSSVVIHMKHGLMVKISRLV